MSAKLTTQQIIDALESKAHPDHSWELALDPYAYSPSEAKNAKAAARFLEEWQPGRTWEADEFHGLMFNHYNGRWSSAAAYGAIHAHGRQVDGIISKETLDHIIDSNESADAYARSLSGVRYYEDDDGAVLIFLRLFHGIIRKPLEV